MIRNRLIAFWCMLLCFCLMNVACAQSNKSKEFVMHGIIKGKDIPKELVLTYERDGKSIDLTSTVVDGAFSFRGEIDEPTTAGTSLFKEPIWLEPTDQLYLEIDTDNATHHLTGSATQAVQDEFYAELQAIYVRSMAGEETPSFDANQFQMDFIRRHPESMFSVFLLYPLSTSEVIPVEQMAELYNALSAEGKNSAFGREIASTIARLRGNGDGLPAPDFEVYDEIHDRMVRLSDLRGKVVVLDFWAPWCGPCRMGFKHLNELYKAHHAEGLEVVAVYTDRRFEPEKWREAIEKDGVGDWHHVKIAADMAAPQPQPGDIRSHYYVQAIPRKILIDRNGMIVKTWVGVSRQYEEEFATLLSNALQDKVKETNK